MPAALGGVWSRLVILGVALLGACNGSTDAESAPTRDDDSLLFQMDLSEGAFPLAGFNGLADTTTNEYSISRRAGAGPGGIPSYVIQQHGSATGSPALQPYIGWSLDLDGHPALGYGQSVYIRFYFRFIDGVRCESWNWGQRETVHVSKFHMIADGSPNGNRSGRTIIAVGCEATNGNPDPTIDSVNFSIMRANADQRCNSNGSIGSPTGYTHVNDTTWIAFQYRLTWSSSENADDASYALWLDNTDEGNPDCEVNTDTWTIAPVIVNATGDYDQFRWGFYWEAIPDLSRDGLMGYELTGYEVGTSFDPTWGNR